MKKTVLPVVLLLLTLLLTSCIVTAQEAVPRAEILEDCPLATLLGPDTLAPYDPECGVIVVPEDYTSESDRTLLLNYMRYPARSENPGSPMIFLHGGPGGYSTPFGPEVVGIDYILENHDIVLFDQRGSQLVLGRVDIDPTGFLNCVELQNGRVDAQEIDAPNDVRRAILNAGIETCYNNYVEAGVNFAALNSLNNAADVNSVREVLGYDTVILHGGSYGTLLAQHVLRDYPETIEAIIFDGSVPLAAVNSWAQGNARAMDYLFDLVFETCANDADCNAAYPDVGSRLDEVLHKLRAEPMTTIQEYQGTERELVIDDVIFAKLASELVGPDISTLPFVVYSIAEGNENVQQAIDLLGSTFVNGAVNGETVSRMTHYAVTCAEDPVYSTLPLFSFGEDLYETALISGIDDAEDYQFACSLMNVPVLPDEARVNVPSDIPVLFLNGKFDPATPTYMNELLAENYPNSFTFEFSNGSHVQIFSPQTNPCVGEIVEQFLTDLTTEPDGSCLADLPPVMFNPNPLGE